MAAVVTTPKVGDLGGSGARDLDWRESEGPCMTQRDLRSVFWAPEHGPIESIGNLGHAAVSA